MHSGIVKYTILVVYINFIKIAKFTIYKKLIYTTKIVDLTISECIVTISAVHEFQLLDSGFSTILHLESTLSSVRKPKIKESSDFAYAVSIFVNLRFSL